MCGIRRHQQDALARAACRQRHRRRARRLADATLPAEKQNALAQESWVGSHFQQQGMLPIGDRSIPILRCQVWNSSRKNG